MLVDKERRHYLSAEVFGSMVARSLALIQDFHQREPMKEGLSKEELRQRLFPELEARIFARVVAALLERGDVESSGEVLRLKGKGRTLTAGEETLRVQLLAKISAAGLGPPRLEELASNLSLPPARVQELMKVAVADRLVVRVSDDLYFDRKAVEHLQERLVGYLQQHKEISTQTFKDLVGQSRKYVIPLSEFFDREKVTLRVGEKRVLRRS